MPLPTNKSGKATWLRVALVAAALCLAAGHWRTMSYAPEGRARLISVEHLPDPGDFCRPPDRTGSEQTSLFRDFEPSTVRAAETVDVTRDPVRTIKDTFPIYSSIAVDPVRGEVILQDTNL